MKGLLARFLMFAASVASADQRGAATVSRLAEETPLAGALVALDETRATIRVAAEPSPVEVAIADLLLIEWDRPTAGQADALARPTRSFGAIGGLWFGDGGRVAATGWEASADGLVVTSEQIDTPLAVGVDEVRAFVKPAIRIDPGVVETAGQELMELSAATRADVLSIIDRENPSAAPTSVEGQVESLNAQGIGFRFGEQRGLVPWTRIAGFALAPLEREPDATRIDDPARSAVVVTTTDGSQVPGDDVEMVADVLTLTRGERSVRLPIASARTIDWRSRKVAYADRWRLLSCAALESSLAAPGPKIAINQSLAGGPLEVATPGPDASRRRSQEYDHGIVLRGPCRCVFRLPTDTRSVRAVVGVAPRKVGDAVVTMRVDDAVVDSFRVAAGDPPHDLHVDAVGATTLTIVVESGANLDVGDIVHFADLRASL